jgi:hypothetical protein
MAERLAEVRSRVAAACASVGQPSDAVTLIAVSKTHPVHAILQAADAGQLHFGENRPEEAVEKIAAASAAVPRHRLIWHMIGHVQSRKAKDVVGAFDLIHSLDSVKLAERYARLAEERDVAPPQALLEVNISGEASKAGFAASGWRTDHTVRETLWREIGQITALASLRVVGLMTIAPMVADPEMARPVFADLRALRDALAGDFPAATWDVLSMGMTDDFEVAIQEGATMIRIGRAIFGSRAG